MSLIITRLLINLSPARPSLAYPTVYFTFSLGCLKGTSISVCPIPDSYSLFSSQVQCTISIIQPVGFFLSKKPARGFGTFSSFISYMRSIKNSNSFHFFVASTLLHIYFIPLKYALPVLSRVKTKNKIYFTL